MEGVNLEVEQGENIVFVGQSGSGKSTTLKMVNALVEPSGGRIEIDGKPIQDYDIIKLRRGIGYIIQQHGLFPHYTVNKNIAVIPQLLGWNKAEINSAIDKWLLQLRLDPKEIKNKYPNELSGGEQQRIGIARALIVKPDILLMDEPFGSLDPLNRNIIRKELKESNVFRDKTMLMVSHDPEEAIAWADRIVVFNQGKIEQIGTPIELLLKPKTEYVSTFFNHQRYSLLLKAIAIRQLDIVGKNENSYQVVNDDTSIEEVTELFLDANIQHVSISGKEGSFNLDDIMSGFAKFIKKEGNELV